MLCFSTTQCVLVYKQNCNLHINKISNWSKTWLTCLFLVRPCLGGHLCPRPPSFTGTGNTADCLEVDSLPTLNATSKNIRQECSAWQRGKVGGPWFVATLKAYFDTTAPFECNLRLFLAVFLSLCTALSALGLSKGPLKWHWTLEGRVKQKGGYSQHPQEWLFLWIVVWERETHHRLLVWGLKIPGKGSRAGAAWCFFFIMPLAGQLVPVKDSSQTTCALALISKVLNDIIKKKHLHFLREIFLIRWPC